MLRSIKMVVHHAHLFVWLVRHTLHKGRRFEFNSTLDHVEGDRSITTIAFCRYCGKTHMFTIGKK